MTSPAVTSVPRITSYNVCYTKLLRVTRERAVGHRVAEVGGAIEVGVGGEGHRAVGVEHGGAAAAAGHARITSYNVCYTKLLRA